MTSAAGGGEKKRAKKGPQKKKKKKTHQKKTRRKHTNPGADVEGLLAEHRGSRRAGEGDANE